MKKLLIASAVLMSAVSSNAIAAEFVQNGGFEQTSRTGNFEFGAAAGAAGQINNWASASPQAYNLLFNSAIANTVNAAGTWQGTGREYMWASTASSQGGNFVALDGDSNVSGPLTQTITGLTAGQSYTLSFEWAAGQLRSRTGDTTERLVYSLGGQSFSTETLNTVSGGFSPWRKVTANFVAGGSSQVLSFLSVGTPNGLPPVALLDNVSLTNAVPEPATWGLMIVGFGAMGAQLRRRRTSAKVSFA